MDQQLDIPMPSVEQLLSQALEYLSMLNDHVYVNDYANYALDTQYNDRHEELRHQLTENLVKWAAQGKVPSA